MKSIYEQKQDIDDKSRIYTDRETSLTGSFQQRLWQRKQTSLER